MSRPGALALAAIAVVLVLAAVWSLPSPPAGLPAPPAAEPDASLDELMPGLHITRLDGEPAPPFALPTLAGGRLALGELAGRPALLYFWATW